MTKFGIVASPVQGRQQGRFSLRAGYAPFSKNFFAFCYEENSRTSEGNTIELKNFSTTFDIPLKDFC